MRVKISDVLAAVSAYYAVPESVIVSRSSIRPIVYIRMVAMFIAREVAEAPGPYWGDQKCPSWPQIGLKFGRDHTTVMYAHRRMTEVSKSHWIVKRDIDAIEQELRGAGDIAALAARGRETRIYDAIRGREFGVARRSRKEFLKLSGRPETAEVLDGRGRRRNCQTIQNADFARAAA